MYIHSIYLPINVHIEFILTDIEAVDIKFIDTKTSKTWKDCRAAIVEMCELYTLHLCGSSDLNY